MCGTFESSITTAGWFDFKCNGESGYSGASVQINGQSATLTFCGMRVYGSGSNVDQSSDYGIAVSIDVDDNGKPYVVNQRGDTYRRDAPSSWTRLTSIKPRTQVSVSSSSSNNY